MTNNIYLAIYIWQSTCCVAFERCQVNDVKNVIKQAAHVITENLNVKTEEIKCAVTQISTISRF